MFKLNFDADAMVITSTMADSGVRVSSTMRDRKTTRWNLQRKNLEKISSKTPILSILNTSRPPLMPLNTAKNWQSILVETRTSKHEAFKCEMTQNQLPSHGQDETMKNCPPAGIALGLIHWFCGTWYRPYWSDYGKSPVVAFAWLTLTVVLKSFSHFAFLVIL
ncbi:hypothetical protein M8C21_019048, partial [Ambrosia artemisiifolia]